MHAFENETHLSRESLGLFLFLLTFFFSDEHNTSFLSSLGNTTICLSFALVLHSVRLFYLFCLAMKATSLLSG